jgi:hypothetical protein
LLLTTSPSKWDETEAFNRMRRKVECLKVVNDCAERAIALMATYNQTLAKGEKRKQDMLQVVENNRKRLKTTSKKELGTYETL